MSDRSTNVWLPVDTTLGPELARATDAALVSLAGEARRIKWVTIGSAVLLSVSSLVLALASDATGWSVAGVFSIVVAAVAFVIGLQKRKLWDGSPAWLHWYYRPITAPSLPAEANEILVELRAGTRHARYRRGGATERVELPFLLLRGPFGPLVLSTDPHVQGLALWNWFAGDRLGIEIEETLPRVSGPANLGVSLEGSDGTAPEQIVMPSGSTPSPAKDETFNQLVLLDEAKLSIILKRTYPEAFEPECKEQRNYDRSRLIVRTYQIARQRQALRRYTTVEDLRNDVVRKLADEGIEFCGLRCDGESVSSSWIDKALSPAGYPSINKELARANARAEAE